MKYYNHETKTFDCTNQNLTTLPDDIPLECEELYCYSNNITSLEPLRRLVNLRILYCWNNEITSLEPLSGLVNLKTLYCYRNNITTLEPLSELVNLRELHCSDNEITSLEPLSELVNLQTLYCHENKITSLEPLSRLVNLQTLYCSNNPIRWVFVDLQKIFKNINYYNLNKYQPMFNHIPAKKIQRYWKFYTYRKLVFAH